MNLTFEEWVSYFAQVASYHWESLEELIDNAHNRGDISDDMAIRLFAFFYSDDR